MVDTARVWFTGSPRAALPANHWVWDYAKQVRVKFDGSQEFRAEAELPKLIFGHNGRICSSQRELNLAVDRFRSALGSVAEFDEWTWTRLDLVWQWKVERASEIILAHQWLKFPGIRNDPSLLYGGKMITWCGAKSRLMFKLYDKARSFGNGAGVLRAELKLAGEQLRKRIDGNAALDFNELWGAFRLELLNFASVTVPEARRHTFAEVSASLTPEQQSRALSVYRLGRSERAIRLFQHQVSNATLKRIAWHWHNKLRKRPRLPAQCEPKAMKVPVSRSRQFRRQGWIT